MPRKAINLKNRKFERLLVIKKAPKPISKLHRKDQFWLCRCDCGEEVIVAADKLKSKMIKSCGCLLAEQVVEMTGNKYGKLTVLERAPAPEHKSEERKKQYHFLCQCDCGNTFIANGNSLRMGSTKSCGCLSNRYTTVDELQLASAKDIYTQRYSDGDLTFDDFMFLTHQNCFYCGVEPRQFHTVFREGHNTEFAIKNGTFIYQGIDRINSKLLHTKANCVPSCVECNYLKGPLHIDEFFDKIIRIYHTSAKVNDKK